MIFPDSDIAKSFTCRKDNGAYIMTYLISKKAGPLVLMFNKSLNHTTKCRLMYYVHSLTHKLMPS